MLLPALLDFFALVLIQLEPSVWRLANRHWIKITVISESYFNHTLTTLLKQISQRNLKEQVTAFTKWKNQFEREHQIIFI